MPYVFDIISEIESAGWLRWPEDQIPEWEHYEYLSVGGTLYYNPSAQHNMQPTAARDSGSEKPNDHRASGG